MSAYETVIGLEVHAQLSTDSKIFSSASASIQQADGAEDEPANTRCDPVVLGLPGTLPVLNKSVVDLGIKLGLATNCKIARESVYSSASTTFIPTCLRVIRFRSSRSLFAWQEFWR